METIAWMYKAMDIINEQDKYDRLLKDINLNLTLIKYASLCVLFLISLILGFLMFVFLPDQLYLYAGY